MQKDHIANMMRRKSINYIDVSKYLDVYLSMLFNDNINVVAGIWSYFFTFIDLSEKEEVRQNRVR